MRPERWGDGSIRLGDEDLRPAGYFAQRGRILSAAVTHPRDVSAMFSCCQDWDSVADGRPAGGGLPRGARAGSSVALAVDRGMRARRALSRLRSVALAVVQHTDLLLYVQILASAAQVIRERQVFALLWKMRMRDGLERLQRLSPHRPPESRKGLRKRPFAGLGQSRPQPRRLRPREL